MKDLNTKRYRTFEEYMEAVDQVTYSIVGLSYLDIEDYDYRRDYESNVSPVRAAKEALREAGWK